MSCPKSNIVVVGHGQILLKLLEESHFFNAEIRSYQYSFSVGTNVNSIKKLKFS